MWSLILLQVISVETEHAGKVFPGSREDIRDYMVEQGYVLVYTVNIDDVFVRKDLHDGKYAPDLEMYDKLMSNMAKFSSFWNIEDEVSNKKDEL